MFIWPQTVNIILLRDFILSSTQQSTHNEKQRNQLILFQAITLRYELAIYNPGWPAILRFHTAMETKIYSNSVADLLDRLLEEQIVELSRRALCLRMAISLEKRHHFYYFLLSNIFLFLFHLLHL